MMRKTPMKRTAFKRKDKPKKRRTLEQKTAAQLMKPADEVFSKYIRLRDTERIGMAFNGSCITCSKYGTVAYIDSDNKLRFVPGWDNGHFISRGVYSLRHDELNCNLQCSFNCNKMKSGNIEKYKTALDNKYGDGTYRRLEDLARLPDAYKRPSKAELLQIITDYKSQVELLIEIK